MPYLCFRPTYKPIATHKDAQLQLRTQPDNKRVEGVMLELELIFVVLSTMRRNYEEI